MDMAEFTKFIQAMKTAYPKENLFSTKESMEYWFQLLQDIPYNMLMAFLGKWSCNERWSPTIADIRRGCLEMSQEEIPDWGKAWQEVMCAISKYGYPQQEKALAMLSPITLKAVQAIGFRDICQSENIDVVRGQFRNIYETYMARERQDAQLPAALLDQVKSFMPGTNEFLLAQFSEVD